MNNNFCYFSLSLNSFATFLLSCYHVLHHINILHSYISPYISCHYLSHHLGRHLSCSLEAMVSIRRRKNLGYSTGQDIASVNDVTVGNTEPVSEHPMPLDDLNLPPREVKYDPAGRDDAPVSDSKEDQINQSNEFGSTTTEEPTAGDVVKRRKQYHRRHPQEKHIRGVYLKNNKYQAAIKVDKEQVHLGTFSSQEEAARLYDRAAFMRGRKSNFELPEEEKQELKKTKWDEFLAMTRSAITSKSKKACR